MQCFINHALAPVYHKNIGIALSALMTRVDPFKIKHKVHKV